MKMIRYVYIHSPISVKRVHDLMNQFRNNIVLLYSSHLG